MVVTRQFFGTNSQQHRSTCGLYQFFNNNTNLKHVTYNYKQEQLVSLSIFHLSLSFSFSLSLLVKENLLLVMKER